MEIFFGYNLENLIQAVGYFGLFGIVFAESGLFIGFFLPGDSLLFTAGFLASQGYLNIYYLTIGSFIAAVLGDNFGYVFGRSIGPKIFKKENSIIFHKNHLDRARIFYERHGGRTLILARFMPIIRTFAPILAGVGNMSWRTFFFYNITGALLWAVGITLVGYILGSTIPGVDRYLIQIIIVIILTSFLPTLAHILRHRVFGKKL